MKTLRIGTVWTATAKLYDRDGKLIASCIDTPNAIAKALMEEKKAEIIKTFGEFKNRSNYESRMKAWNKAKSNLQYNQRGKNDN
jgi:hypothetical protein